MKQAEIKKNILKIATDVFRDTQVLFAYLYGSYAVNQAHQFSDLDIGIYVPRLSRREKLNLEMALALKIDKKLKQCPASDVRIINSLPLAVAGKIITEGVLIYCRDDKARVDYETAIRSAYFDFFTIYSQLSEDIFGTDSIVIQDKGLKNSFNRKNITKVYSIGRISGAFRRDC